MERLLSLNSVISLLFNLIATSIGTIGVHLLFDNVIITWLTFFCFMTILTWLSATTISPNHRGLLIFLGKRLHTELPEGLNFWLPKPIGDIDIHDMRIQDPTNLSFTDHKAISVADGTKLEHAEISILWKKEAGSLYDVTTIGGDVSAYIKELAEDRVRNAALAITLITSNEVKSNCRNLDVLVLEQSITKWQNVIKDGLKALTPDEQILLEESGRKLPNSKKSLSGILSDVGITIEHLTISSVKLPDRIRAVIDNLVLEPIEGDRESKNMDALLKESKKLHEFTDGDKEFATMVAMIEKGTPNVSMHSVRGNSKTTDMDKLSASLFTKNATSNNSGGAE